MTTLPRDNNHDTIQALRLKDGGAHQLDATATSARNVSAFDDQTRVVSVYADQPIFIAFGDETVNATNSDHYFPAGLYYDFSISGGSQQFTHIAILAASANATVYVSEKQ